MKLLGFVITVFISMTFFSCSDATLMKRQLSKNAPTNSKSPFLKAHMPNGDVYIFSQWEINEANHSVSGSGVKQNPNRETIDSGRVDLPIQSVSLFETNIQEPHRAIRSMTIISGISLLGSAICLTNPKACFGSCPTFYIDYNGEQHLQAEGFSSSISPSLEATDVDALYHAKPSGKIFRIEMKNEALETHSVRHVNLLLVPKSTERSIQDINGDFYQTERLLKPNNAVGDEGNIAPLISEMDGNERFSLSDEKNLKSDEYILLDFSVEPGKNYGFVIGGRQTLLTTFLLYQAYAYMGNEYGKWLTMLEQNHNLFSDVDPSRFLGGIEIQEQNRLGFWSTVGEINEFGPLATDLHMVRLNPQDSEAKKIRLKLNKGNWRIDYISLAELGKKAEPVRLSPIKVFSGNEENKSALENLTDPKKMLTTLPGDEYSIQFELPENYNDYTFYLESKGFYLEWMRDEWAKEESEEKLVQLVTNPSRTLKELAPKFKELEPSMEKVFWSSKYAK